MTEEWTDFSGDTTQTFLNEGQVYYNTATDLIKLSKKVFGTGAWAAGGNLTTQELD